MIKSVSPTFVLAMTGIPIAISSPCLVGEDAFLGLLADGFPVYGPVENGVTLTSSDLDNYHGHTTATADFPEGIYHYHITADDPYINGNGYFGTKGNISN